jgi:hypothetical protein
MVNVTSNIQFFPNVSTKLSKCDKTMHVQAALPVAAFKHHDPAATSHRSATIPSCYEHNETERLIQLAPIYQSCRLIILRIIPLYFPIYKFLN